MLMSLLRGAWCSLRPEQADGTWKEDSGAAALQETAGVSESESQTQNVERRDSRHGPGARGTREAEWLERWRSPSAGCARGDRASGANVGTLGRDRALGRRLEESPAVVAVAGLEERRMRRRPIRRLHLRNRSRRRRYERRQDQHGKEAGKPVHTSGASACRVGRCEPAGPALPADGRTELPIGTRSKRSNPAERKSSRVREIFFCIPGRADSVRRSLLWIGARTPA